MSVSHENDLLLLTCASGKQASRLIPLLHGKWRRLRLVVNSGPSEDRLKKQWPNTEVIRADLEKSQDCRRIMVDVTTVFHIGPTLHPHETEIGYFMIDAAVHEAQHGSFKHFVYSSVLGSQLRKLMNHDCKRYVEEYLFESGLDYTVLQPTHFMDLFPVAMLMGQVEPVYTANWNPEVPFSFVALQDLADAAARVIEEREKHFLAQYPLSSTRAYPYTEVVKLVGEAIGKEIRVETRGIEDATQALTAMLSGSTGHTSVHPKARDTAHRLILYYNYHGLAGNPNVLEWLIGRKPTTHQEWVKVQVQNARQS